MKGTPLGLRRTAGFTLLELLVVVGILAALVALALPYYQDYIAQSKLTAAQTDLKTFAKALAMYDQLEPTPYATTTALPLIGKYVQDFRATANQTVPRDPWGADYLFRYETGTIISGGPDRSVDTTAAGARIPSGDDLLVTWKPPFCVSSIRAIDVRWIEVTFSRKVVESTVAANAVTAPSASDQVVKVSDNIYRFHLISDLTPGTLTGTLSGSIRAMDKSAAGFDTDPLGGPGESESFTF